MRLIEKPNKARALSLLSQAQGEADDIAYAMLVCEAADIAKALEGSSTEGAIPIWERIAHLDADRARMWELVDHARRKVQSAGNTSPPTIDQEYEQYLATLPPDQRCLMQVRYFHRVVMSMCSAAEKRNAALRAMELLGEYEQTRVLSKKQALMKIAFRAALERHA